MSTAHTWKQLQEIKKYSYQNQYKGTVKINDRDYFICDMTLLQTTGAILMLEQQIHRLEDFYNDEPYVTLAEETWLEREGQTCFVLHQDLQKKYRQLKGLTPNNVIPFEAYAEAAMLGFKPGVKQYKKMNLREKQ